MQQTVHLGRFELTELIRRGGMAEVWRGVHREARVPVAVKFVTEERARTRYLREALRNEVRAMARLDHGCVVRVLDYGDVPRETAEQSEGRIAAASPYLVMELADSGTLAPRHVKNFADLREVLGALLAALGHAHARGVVHRDIKPSNVLVTGSPRVFKLSDFGIAHALGFRVEAESSVPLSAGTAWFMAPEQILGLHRDEGPWTDLYSVGCLAHLLATGRMPFPGKDHERVYRAHILAPPPPLAPRFAVPSDFAVWLDVLLAKQPRSRFALAADALRALETLGGDPLGPRGEAGPELRDMETAALDADAPTPGTISSSVGSDARTETALTNLAFEVGAGDPSLDPSRRRRSQEMRVAGQVDTTAKSELRARVAAQLEHLAQAALERERPGMLLTGIGLGVYGLRSIPLIGRDKERCVLVEALRDAWESASPRVMEVRGRAGLGKTRLAEWLAERASETGAATALWGALGPTPSLGEGLSRMLLRHLRAENLPRDRVEERIGDHPTEPALDALDQRERARLVDLLAPESVARAMTRPEERYAVAQRLLAALGRERPVIMVFDDAQLGRDAIGFAEHLLRVRGARLPVLVVLTVQEEAVELRPAEAAQLDALAQKPGAKRLELGPLADAEHARLVGAMLGLEEALARDIANRTAGNPLFAIQLVGDWVQRGELVAGPRGFALREGASLVLPDDIHGLWSARLARLLGSLAEETRSVAATVLELAALLGRQVELPEWDAACREAAVAVPEGLLDALASQRLALVGRARFSFVHGMLQESLTRRARENGRWEELHRACARSLARAQGTRGWAERVGRHLAAAGEGIEAAPLLLEAARDRLAVCDFPEVHALSALYDEGLASAGVGEDDARRAQGALMRAEGAVGQGRLDECTRWVERALGASADPRIAAEICQLRGRIALKRGQNGDAAVFYREAKDRMSALGDRLGAAHAIHGLGDAEKLLGRLEESLRHQEEAARLFDDLGALVDAARTRMSLADVVRRRGELDRAVAILEQTVEVTRRLSNGHAVGVGLNTLGDIARARGELAEAERLYRTGLSELEALASEEATIVRLNLGLTLLARGEFVAAREIFEVGRRDLDQEGRRGYLAFVLAALFVCDAAERRWPDYDARVAETEALLAQVALFDEDLAWCLDRAARLALEAQEDERAARAITLALAQWHALDRADEAAALRALEASRRN